MSASAFSNAKTHQRFRTDEVIVKLLWLALEEHIFLGVEYQGGAGDLFSNAVTEIVIKCRCDVGPRCGRSRNEHAMGKGHAAGGEVSITLPACGRTPEILLLWPRPPQQLFALAEQGQGW
jgi:hypothetical protein